MKIKIFTLFFLSNLFVNAFAKSYPEVKVQIIKETTLVTEEMKNQNPNIPVCSFARKDYDSIGFGITYRDGMYIKGQFGCVYYCGFKEKAYYVTHVYRNEYFDPEVWKKDTGGPKRAKWFICPHSVDESTWKPIIDELGRIISYYVEEDRTFFEPRVLTSVKELSLREKTVNP